MPPPFNSDDWDGFDPDDDDHIPYTDDGIGRGGNGVAPPALQNLHQILHANNFSADLIATTFDGMSSTDLRHLVLRLISTITDRVFRSRLLRMFGRYIQEHPYLVASGIVGLILALNPIALAGFGALGPVAGSLAAAWQSSIGASVAAGSAFAILQSVGMLGAVAIPAAGGGVLSITLLAAIWNRLRGSRAGE